MNKIKIGIVEDEAIIADDIRALLEDLGYEVPEPCGNYNEAITMLQQEHPDMAILDINLNSERDGVDIGRYIRDGMNIPFIFLTANSDPGTVARAKEVQPNAYLVKPFQKDDLYTSIEIALYNFNKKKNTIRKPDVENGGSELLKNTLFVKEGDYFHKVNFSDILYLSSEHVYVTIHTTTKKFLVRASMQQYLENFDAAKFFRVHRSYIVNLDKIDKINTANIIINGIEVPISKSYRDELLKLLNIC